MKKFYFIISFLLLSSVAIANDNYRSDAIYVKFKDISKLPILQSSSSQYTISPVVNNKMLTSIPLTAKQKALFDELKLIRKIEYKTEIDPFKVAKQFTKRTDVEYAEPIPISRTFEKETNDPELARLFQVYITNAAKAWELMIGDTVTIAIVDTGLDFDHEDLKNVVWYNNKEMGIDSKGNDKASNGVDDDKNGYIDDWRGWDFGSESGYDNDPSYGGNHGVHVAGIAAAESNNEVGITGMCPLAKIIAVKVGPDFGLDNSVYNEYEGLLYSAILGADVINCSWGTPGFSLTNKLIVNTAVELGSVIVAAAGNNGINEKFYPASFKSVISVASTTDEDTRSSFSNYNTDVDISAPGTFIFSTVPDDKYEYKSGTSMASPVVAGAVAVLRSQFPNLTPKEISALLKVNADNIDELNPNYSGLMGNGRLNLLNALNKVKNKAIELIDYKIITGNSIGIIETGTTIKVDLKFENILEDIDNLRLEVNNDENYPLTISNSSFDFNDVSKEERIEITDLLELKLPNHLPENYNYDIKITAFIDGEKSQNFYVSFVSNQSYINLRNENIALTVSAKGNYGFNDYPDNSQGIGLVYKDSTNLLFESGFMLADIGRFEGVIDGLRIRSNKKDNDFFSIDKVAFQENDSTKYVTSKFNDYSEFGFDLDSIDLNVQVTQESIIFDEDGLEKSVLFKYVLQNKNDYNMDSVYAGLFFDWDISGGGNNDFIYFDTASTSGFAEVPDAANSPVVAIKMHSQYGFNCYAIDNASFKDEMGIYDGFTEEEKFMTLTSGKKRLMSRKNKDASMVIGAGPMFLPANATNTLYFSINIADSKQAAVEAAKQMQGKVDLFEYVSNDSNVEEFSILNIAPNPINYNSADVTFWTSENMEIQLKVYDSMGREIRDFGTKQLINGFNLVPIITNGLSQGAYYLGVINKGKLFSYPMTIVNE